MLFLMNDRILEVETPEVRLRQCWHKLGCGDPYQLRAQDAIAFVCQRLQDNLTGDSELDHEVLSDLASLIIAKTGANSFVLKPTASGGWEPRLRDLPRLVLEAYQRGAANDAGQRFARSLREA